MSLKPIKLSVLKAETWIPYASVFRFNLFDPFDLGERFAFAEACR